MIVNFLGVCSITALFVTPSLLDHFSITQQEITSHSVVAATTLMQEHTEELVAPEPTSPEGSHLITTGLLEDEVPIADREIQEEVLDT